MPLTAETCAALSRLAHAEANALRDPAYVPDDSVLCEPRAEVTDADRDEAAWLDGLAARLQVEADYLEMVEYAEIAAECEAALSELSEERAG